MKQFQFVLLILGILSGAALAEYPEVKVKNVRRAFHNGEHNAFTDLIRWNDAFWLTFRSCPDGHGVARSASIIILRSADAKTWEQVHQFSVPDRDTRDPHFLSFKDQLFVYTGTWWSGVEGNLPREQYEINQHLGYAARTRDGETWGDPEQLEGTYGHYIWRAIADGERAYLCARRKRGYSEADSGAGGVRIMEGALLESEDGINWRFLSLFQKEKGNETAFQFQDDGTLVALSREEGDSSKLARAKPPFKEWEHANIPFYIGGPLLACWGDRWLVGGRRKTDAGPKTTLYWLIDDEPVAFAELPSGGDNSYPGFVEIDDKQALISWYSSHEKDENGNTITAIYLADLVIE